VKGSGDQLQLGDHAFTGYGDDDLRWEAAFAFAALGFACGDKVVIVPDPAVPCDITVVAGAGFECGAGHALRATEVELGTRVQPAGGC